MKSRLRDLPRYSTEKTWIEAACYNQVRLALLRLGNPLRVALPALRTLEMILDDETWICVDTSLNDIPVLAWTDFETAHRASLHESIPCRFFSYHAQAQVIENQVLQTVREILSQRLPGNAP